MWYFTEGSECTWPYMSGQKEAAKGAFPAILVQPA